MGDLLGWLTEPAVRWANAALAQVGVSFRFENFGEVLVGVASLLFVTWMALHLLLDD